MSNVKLSVVVPVYNVEKYLCKCLESLVNQTLKSMEIIIVNDGSTDHSKNICIDYSRKYENVTLISQENKGLGAARNIGIKHSKGEYITFVDSDDYVLDNMYEKMLDLAVKEELDLVTCSVAMYFENSGKTRIIENNINEDIVLNKEMLVNKILNKNIQCFAWNKIYKRDLFNDIGYEENTYYEDMYTFYSIAQKCNRIKCINTPFYIYRQRENNITSNTSLKHIQDFNLAIEKISSDFINNNFYNRGLMIAFIINSLHISLDLYVKYSEFNTYEFYKNYKEVYDKVKEYSIFTVILNSDILFKNKINYLLFKLKLFPLVKKIIYIVR